MPDAPKVFKKNIVKSLRLQDISGQYDRNRHIAYNAKRPEHHKFYWSAQWKNFRTWMRGKKYMQLCEICQQNGYITPTQLLDHIIPVEEAWDLRLDPKNIRPLCRSCHERYGARAKSRRTAKKNRKNAYERDPDIEI